MNEDPQPEAGSPARQAMRNVNDVHRQGMNRGETLALFITAHVGKMGFFLGILAWTVLWLGWNTLAPKVLRFDPPTGFVFWLFISNMIQLLLMPLLLIGQNLQGRHAEMRTESDYAVNVRSAGEIEHILQRLDEQRAMLEGIRQQLAGAPPAPQS